MISGQGVSIVHPVRFAASSAHIDTPQLIAAARQIAPVALLTALRTAPPGVQRMFWQHTDHPLTLAGFGTAAEIVAYGRDRFASIQQQADGLFQSAQFDTPAIARPRLMGGFAFRDDFAAADGVWAAFPAAYFALPRVQIAQMNGETWLTVTTMIDGQMDIDHAWSALHAELDRAEQRLFSPPLSAPPAALVRVQDRLERRDWQQQVHEAVRRIRAGELDKVVLSRFKDVQFDSALDPLRALERLTEAYPQAYRFLIEVYPGHAFFGATPELLAAKQGGQLQTAGLAGSRPRGQTPDEDAALAAELMASAKERMEHQVVVDTLRALLRPFSTHIDIPDQPTVMKLRNIQHLYTPISAALNGRTALLHLIGALHPTPALGGYPRQTAIDTIRRVEKADRGWYAAPVGWMDAAGDGMFAVAIRSAVSAGEQARLYAGAGIVADSEPEREWEETALKFKPLLNALEIPDYAPAES